MESFASVRKSPLETGLAHLRVLYYSESAFGMGIAQLATRERKLREA